MINMELNNQAISEQQAAKEPQPISVELNIKLRDAAIIALLEDYGKFLMKKGLVADVEAVKAKLGEICSPAIDRGIITQAIIDHVFGNIEKNMPKYTADKADKCCKKFLKHALVEEMAEVADMNTLDPDFQKAIDLYNQCKAATEVLIEKYGNNIKAHACAFYNEFKNLFDPAFSECVASFC